VGSSYDGTMTIPEPRRPESETFGLTKERRAEFENASPWFMTRLLAVASVVAFIWMGSKFFSHGGLKDPDSIGAIVSMLILIFFGLMLSFAAGFIVAFPGGMILEAVWKRMQPDYDRFVLYERAMEEYKTDHAAWLTTQRSWWDRLHPQRFEQEVAGFFKKQGHSVEWTGRSGDGGVDIRLTTQDGRKIIVQCKAHEKPVSPGAVRDLYGTLLHEQSDEAWLMSRSGFTVGASKFAAGKAIRLFDLDHVLPGLGAIADSRPAVRRR
jgi:HJR/Mrr/RecB family endonuclease